MSTVLYFAYGSNMLTSRLQMPKRVPSAEPIEVGFVKGHVLMFDKVSIDGSGKCDCEETDDGNACVYGVLYNIPLSEKPGLDKAEGLGSGYAEKHVQVFPVSGAEPVEAITYYATKKDPALRPTASYKGFVLEGAKEHELPAEYISRFIAGVETVEDKNRK